MNNEFFNLIDDPWVPVLMLNGTTHRVSLQELFAKADAISDLALNPYERIAVIRLLVCISMAALGEENLLDEIRWKACLPKLSESVLDYLKKWHQRFNLYGEHAFMQPDELFAEEKAKACCDKLFPHLSSGNNNTLFDHQAGEGERKINDACRIIGLLTYINFSAGGQHAKCYWSTEETSASVSLAPSREKSMLHTMILGENFLQTVWLNLVTQDIVNSLPEKNIGRPIWEMDDLSRTNIEGKGIEKTLLGRLVPLSRVIKLEHSQHLCIMGEGLKYAQLPAAREVMGTTTRCKDPKDNEKALYVGASSSKLPWRDLQAILSQTEKHGTPVLRHLKSLPQDDEFVIWTGGLITNQAKDEAVVEWTARLSGTLLTDPALTKYQNGIDFANKCLVKLHFALKEYVDGIIISETKKQNRTSVPDAVKVPAERFFWDELSVYQPLLTAIAEDRENADSKDWQQIVESAAKHAYEYACPKINGRQIAAYVNGLKKLVK
ncbi:MAG: type I-E CRISPR-associated protein Cse1/CasA [Lentisphaeria bacterium]